MRSTKFKKVLALMLTVFMSVSSFTPAQVFAEEGEPAAAVEMIQNEDETPPDTQPTPEQEEKQEESAENVAESSEEKEEDSSLSESLPEEQPAEESQDEEPPAVEEDTSVNEESSEEGTDEKESEEASSVDKKAKPEEESVPEEKTPKKSGIKLAAIRLAKTSYEPSSSAKVGTLTLDKTSDRIGWRSTSGSWENETEWSHVHRNAKDGSVLACVEPAVPSTDGAKYDVYDMAGVWSASVIKETALGVYYIQNKTSYNKYTKDALVQSWVWMKTAGLKGVGTSEGKGTIYVYDANNSSYSLSASQGKAVMADTQAWVTAHKSEYTNAKAYYCWHETSQNMAYFSIEEAPGEIIVSKSSSASAAYVTAHALTGAEYTIYTDANATKKLSGAAVLKIKASGKSQAVEVPAGTYYVKETKAPTGYALDTKIHKVTVSAGAQSTVKSSEAPTKKKVTLKKTAKENEFYNQVKDLSAYKDMTATFTVTITDLDGNKKTSTITTNSNGVWTSNAYEAGTKFEFTETVAPKNYLLPTAAADKTKTITLSLTDANNTVTFADDCMGDPADLRIKKVDPKYVDIETDKYAEFDVWYYDNQDASGEPVRHWVYRTINGAVKFDVDTPISGDAVYTDTTGAITFPVGSLKIQEKASPEGYVRVMNEWVAQISQIAPGEPPIMQWISQSETGLFEYTDPDNVNIVNRRVRGGVKILKVNADTNMIDAALEGTVVGIYAAEEIQDKDNEVTYQANDLVKSIVVGSDGIASTAERDLPAGKYYMKETSTIAGFQKNTEWRGTFEIEDTSEADSIIVDLTDMPLANKPQKMHTVASDVKTGGHIGVAEEEAQVSDIVYFENLDDGKSYFITGKLLDAETGAQIGGLSWANLAIDEGGAKSGNIDGVWYSKGTGSITMPPFTFNAKEYAGKDVVVVETLSILPEMGVLLRHESLEDANQTVSYVKIGTTAKDGANENHTGTISQNATIVDTVALENLKVGESYTLKGRLMNSDGTEFAGAEARETTFQATAKNMNVDMTFTFNSEGLEGKSLVVFEKLFYNDVEIASHEDVEDEGQTVTYPGIKTFARDADTQTNTGTVKQNAKIIDKVQLEGLVIGHEYVVRGSIMNEEGNLLAETAKAEKTVTATAQEMDVELEFDINASELAGKSVVVYEKLFKEGQEIAKHEDINDEHQTIRYPEVKTSAKDTDTEDKVGTYGETATITDTVSYKNLIVGKEYTVRGVLMNKKTGEALVDGEGHDITAEKTFTAETKDGTVALVFTLDSRLLAGESVVVFENLYHEDVNVASHADITDDDQTVNYPSVSTTAIDSRTQDHVATTDSDTAVIDTVSMNNLVVGKTYTVRGTLMDKETGSAITDVEGNAITATKEFTATAASMEVELTFELDGTNRLNKKTVAFEQLEHNGFVVAVHKDINDEGQTVYHPEVKTSAVDGTTNAQVGVVVENATIVDTVTYKNLVPGMKYKVEGILMDTETGQPYIDGNGNQVKATSEEWTVEAGHENGTIDVTFNFNASNLADRSVVVFENLLHGEVVVAKHRDLSDEGQTVRYPGLETNATDGQTGDHTGTIGETTIVDEVFYKGLLLGKEYTITGVLHERDSKTGADLGELLISGQKVVASVTFTAGTAQDGITMDVDAEHGLVSGTANLVYTLDASALEGKVIVVFEDLMYEGTKIATHADIADEAQTIYYPKVRTQAMDTRAQDHVGTTDEDTQIKDTVSIDNLVIGDAYTVRGKLIDRGTGLTLKDAQGVDITAEKEITATDAHMDVELTFSLDGTARQNKTTVVFEELLHNDIVVGSHKAIGDEKQTIWHPSIKTSAVDKTTESKVGIAQEETVIVDTVTYRNLVPGMKYQVKGVLMNQATGEKYLDANGNEVHAESAEWTVEAGKETGTVDIEFKFNGTNLSGASLVVFEDLLHNGITVATHADIEDEKQTVHYPGLKTNAHDGKTETNIGTVGTEETIIDVVTYTGLIAGEEYTISGVLHERAADGTDKGELLINGQKVVASVTFTAGEDQEGITYEVDAESGTVSGTADLVYTLNSSALTGKVIVVFEDLLYDGKEVVSHADITDEAQTIYYPEVGTTAKDSRTGDHVGTTDEDTTIVDTVTLKNLVVGKAYKVKGVLMDKDTNAAVKDAEGKEIKAEKEFTAIAANMDIELSFELDGKARENMTTVAFEKLEYDGTIVAVHEDINDEGQTVHHPEVKTSAIDRETSDDVGYAAEETVIVDTVTYKNLIPGMKYQVKGVLMDQATGEVYLDADGNEVHAESEEWTVEAGKENGTIDLEFRFNGTNLENKTLVVFEDLMHNNVKVAVHADIEDESQTVHYPKIRTNASDGKTEDHSGTIGEEETIIDIVTYENLIPGKEYTVSGVLHKRDRATGEDMGELVIGEENVVASVTFTAGEEQDGITFEIDEEKNSVKGTVKLVYTLDSSALEDTDVVVFEDLIHNGVTVTSHADITDEEQSIHYPKVRTTALDDKTQNHVGTEEEEAKIHDVVKLNNLIVGEEYTVSGKLMLEGGEESYKDKDGNEVTAETTFKATEADMEVEVIFTLDASELEGQTFVVFEKLLHKDVEIARHEDRNDETQSIHYPKVRTTATDKTTGTHTGVIGQTVIVDKVELTNLVPGEEYEVKGKLMRRYGGTVEGEEPEALEMFPLDEGTVAEVTTTFIADASEMTVYLEFPVNASDMKGATVVVFEKLFNNEVEVARHEDINDEGQSVHFPFVVTLAKTICGEAEEPLHHIGAIGEAIHLQDSVGLHNVVPGDTYKIVGHLMYSDGTEVEPERYQTKPVVYTAQENYEEVQVDFVVDTRGMEGKTIVVFEKLLMTGHEPEEGGLEPQDVEVVLHEDIEDELQMIRFHSIQTTLLGADTEDHIAIADKDVTLVDTVAYSNLEQFQQYIIKGTLMDKATGKPLQDKDGKPVTAEAEIYLDSYEASRDGTIDVVFKNIDASALAGKTVVAFESLYTTAVTEEVLLTKHEDINDENQTLVFPEIRTKARDAKDGDDKVAEGKVKIIDTVTYKNLIPGKEYVVKGTLMNKATGKEFTRGGKSVTADARFIPKEANGMVEVTFNFDSTGMKETDLVVFERVYIVKAGSKDELMEVGRHEDLKDKDQTIKVIPDNPKTGDTTDIKPYVIAGGCALVLMLLLLILKRKRNKKA